LEEYVELEWDPWLPWGAPLCTAFLESSDPSAFTSKQRFFPFLSSLSSSNHSAQDAEAHRQKLSNMQLLDVIPPKKPKKKHEALRSVVLI
jgi:hypothetical protein